MMALAERLPLWRYLPARVRSVLRGVFNPRLYPVSIQIESTRRCNLRCVICATEHRGREKYPDLSAEAFCRVIDQIPTLRDVTLNGLGEPLLNRELLDMIEAARERGLGTRFITNLTRLSDEDAERLVTSGHSEVIVSIDTADADVFADIRRGASLEKVLENLYRLVEVKKRLGSETPILMAHAILLKCALPGISGLIEILKEVEAENLTIVDFNTWGLDLDARLADGSRLGDNALPNYLREEEIRSLLNEIKHGATESFRVVVPGDHGDLKLHHHSRPGILTCRELWESPFVTCNGVVTPCCWATDPKIATMGNITEQSFREIWFGPAYSKLRWQHLTHRHPLFCAMCQQLMYTVEEPSPLRGRSEVRHRYQKGFLSGGLGRGTGRGLRSEA